MSRRAATRPAIAILALLSSGCGFLGLFTRDDVPRGWRRPSAAETAQAWRDDSPHRYLRVRADFTGDGLVDEAAFLVELPGERLVLVMEEAHEDRGPTMHLVDDLGDVALLEAAGVDVAGPGTYRVICDDDADARCRTPDGKRPLEIGLPAITYFKPESWSRLVYWNPSTRQLDEIWTAD